MKHLRGQVLRRASPDLAGQVENVLRSPGQPLDAGTRSFMESRFAQDFSGVPRSPMGMQRKLAIAPAGDAREHQADRVAADVMRMRPASVLPHRRTDFSHVRVHADAAASESARAAGALAYTVGSHIVFRADRYAPGTDTGRELLAHELAHVAQHAPGVLHRKPDCDIQHVVTECAGAQTRCGTVKEYCDKKYPKASDVKSLHEQAVGGAAAYAHLPNASKNLQHFLDGTGTEQVMPVNVFKTHAETKDKLENEHRDKFVEGARKRLAKGTLAAGASADMVWTGTAQAFEGTETDLGLSVGGYTLCSKVTVNAQAQGKSGDVRLVFAKWTVQAFDCYNWDPGKFLGGLFGGINDKDLCCIQNGGLGKHFRIRTAEWNNDHAPSMTPVTITASTPPAPFVGPPAGGNGGTR